MILLDDGNQKLQIQDERISADFFVRPEVMRQLEQSSLTNISKLKISGCILEDFRFLEHLPNLQMLYFLGCKSENWNMLHGSGKIISLGLHNLKQGKHYLDSTRFLMTFPGLEYLYANLIGAASLPELSKLEFFHTIIGTFRNENAIHHPFVFTDFEWILNLKIFHGYAPVDRYRVAAEDFLPVIRNESLTSFGYFQMFPVEDRKVQKLIEEYHPALAETSLSLEQLMVIRREKFCG